MKALVFIGLKIVEIIGVGIVGWLFYRLGWVLQRTPGFGDPEVSVWIHSFVGIFLVTAIGLVCIGMYGFVLKNLEWADDVINWWKYGRK